MDIAALRAGRGFIASHSRRQIDESCAVEVSRKGGGVCRWSCLILPAVGIRNQEQLQEAQKVKDQ